jgi:tripartite-type tricarboxylate transporter receptor subunit TctC
VKQPETVQQFAAAGIDPVGGGPDEYGRAIKEENDRVAKVVKEAKIKPE